MSACSFDYSFTAPHSLLHRIVAGFIAVLRVDQEPGDGRHQVKRGDDVQRHGPVAVTVDNVRENDGAEGSANLFGSVHRGAKDGSVPAAEVDGGGPRWRQGEHRQCAGDGDENSGGSRIVGQSTREHEV